MQTGRLPTLEMPFPDAEDLSPEGPHGTKPDPARKRETPGAPVVLKKRISAAVFFGIIVLLLAALGASALAINSRKVQVPAVDAKREAAVARQRQLRMEAAAFVAQGNVEGAYQKYQDLRALAPNSHAVAAILGKLDQVRSEQMTTRQRLDQASAKLEEGKALYDKKQFEKAIPAFEEAFHLNPNLEDAVNFLRMTREQLQLRQVRTTTEVPGTQTRGTTLTPRGTTISDVARQAEALPSTLVTIFNSTVTDGYMTVKANGEPLLSESLFEDRRGVFRRKVPRKIQVSKPVPSASLEIEVWVVIPSLKIQERKVLRQTFQPNVTHRLVVTLNQATKKLDFQLN